MVDAKSVETDLNFSLLATPAEGLSGRFVAVDKVHYGVIEEVTDREYYTNSYHIPVYFPINAVDKIKLEAPFHELTNGGHITYVEMGIDPLKNLDAFKQIVQIMKKEGIGYGSINHPIDRCPVCCYQGLIEDTCPSCGRHEYEAIPFETLSEKSKELILSGKNQKARLENGFVGNGVPFERIRRITGYLVGTLERFNKAKRSEVNDRVSHRL
jgi:ribonucleoside-triphosphate reductase